MASTQQYSLRWNNYFRHITYALDNHRTNDDFVDVTLYCDGRTIKAHKVVLSSCSSYFKEIFKENPHPHPVIIFNFIKFEDLNSIIDFMYQGEVNVQQEALQSFLHTAEMLAVQGLTSDEKDKPKAPTTNIFDDIKLIKTIPSTIRALSDTTGVTQTTQTIEIPTATILQPSTQQIQQQNNPQQHHIPTQIQHIQIQHQPQVQPTSHQLQKQQQQQQQQHQPQQQHQQHLTNSSNTVTLPANSIMKKRKITFSDDDDNMYTTETVNYTVKDEQTIVKTGEMAFLRGEVKMDIPEYIVSEVDESDNLADGATQQSPQDGTTVGNQSVAQYTSEYEILTESEIEEKYNQGDSDNAEITIEMGRLLNASNDSNAGNGQGTLEESSILTSSGGNSLVTRGSGGGGGTSGGSTKVDKQQTNNTGDEFLLCKVCKRRLQSMNALRRHMTSRHSEISGKEYECTMCNKSFKTKWSLSTHNSRFHRDVRSAKECMPIEIL